MLPGHRVSARIIKRLLVTNYLAPINGMVFPDSLRRSCDSFLPQCRVVKSKIFF